MSENGGPKISKKTGVQKGRKQVMQSEQKSCRTSACGPLKELSTAEQQTADLQGLRDTPLVPRGHGGGYIDIGGRDSPQDVFDPWVRWDLGLDRIRSFSVIVVS